MHLARVRSHVTGFVAAALILLSSAAFVVPDSNAVVTGGIVPCAGLPNPAHPHYAAGVVIVLKGQVTWKSTSQGSLQDVLPSRAAGQQRVGSNSTFRFVLEPGRYVLEAAQSSDVAAYRTVVLQPGDDLYVDIPNVCI